MTTATRRRLVVPTVIGIALMVYPYFVDSSLGLVTIGIFQLGALLAGTRTAVTVRKYDLLTAAEMR